MLYRGSVNGAARKVGEVTADASLMESRTKQVRTSFHFILLFCLCFFIENKMNQMTFLHFCFLLLELSCLMRPLCNSVNKRLVLLREINVQILLFVINVNF